MNARSTQSGSPFLINVSDVLREGSAQPFRNEGHTPERIGAEMIGVDAGADVLVDGFITALGGGVLVDAEISAPLHGTCVRCLAELNDHLDIHVTQAFSASAGFLTASDDDEEDLDDEAPLLTDDNADITQPVIDETVLTLPFNPTCEDFGHACAEADTEVPEPDGVSEEVAEEQAQATDPRWAALADKFASLSDDEKDTK
ncbi:DUF177 domain-containing protein [Corynebacterium sp. TAE3-ERU12]|uniref:YceD family protein n=1 Tax=Corynebacterium sp. TAE3-ERU12 TaxID=2849491 RepID=UPI001C47D71B|nr:YceD family protein [Corynebacterium sp. TAE3-ERU12]MBV7295198.1 DUF177 domain-containing protein [Corynebacterium sp. TAE3-ERU12]